MSFLKQSLERRPSDDSENSNAAALNQENQLGPELSDTKTEFDVRSRALSNPFDTRHRALSLQLVSEVTDSTDNDSPRIVLSRCNSQNENIGDLRLKLVEPYEIESVERLVQGQAPSNMQVPNNVWRNYLGVKSPRKENNNEIPDTNIEILVNLAVPFKDFENIRDAKGFNYLLIVKAYGDNIQYSGIWKIKRISDDGKTAICKDRLKGSEPNSVTPYEICSIDVMGKPQIHILKSPHEDLIDNFPKGYVQLAPPLEFRFRSTVFSISDIENVRQSIRADIFCELRVKRISSVKNVEFTTALLEMYGIRETVIKFANQTEESSKSEYWPDMSEDAESGGDVYDYTIKKRLQGVFIDRMELEEFPFDREEINFRIAVSVPKQLVSLIPNEKYPGHFIASGFQLADLFDAYDQVDLEPGFTDKFESSVGLIYPMMTITVYMDRKPWYYVYNVILPMTILTFLAAVAFSDIFQTKRSDKLTISLTVLFTAVAYKFVVASSLPQISYLTELDQYVNLCFVFITVLVSEVAVFPTLVWICKSIYSWVASIINHQCSVELNTWKDYEIYEAAFAFIYVASFAAINAYWAFDLNRRIGKREKLDQPKIDQPQTGSESGDQGGAVVKVPLSG